MLLKTQYLKKGIAVKRSKTEMSKTVVEKKISNDKMIETKISKFEI